LVVLQLALAVLRLACPHKQRHKQRRHLPLDQHYLRKQWVIVPSSVAVA
jgi:hypothetical protein